MEVKCFYHLLCKVPLEDFCCDLAIFIYIMNNIILYIYIYELDCIKAGVDKLAEYYIKSVLIRIRIHNPDCNYGALMYLN